LLTKFEKLKTLKTRVDMSTFSIFLGLTVIICFLLILVVMVQNPKGGGLSSAFGGSSQQLGGVQKTTDFLDRSTWVLATLLLALILISNSMISLPNSENESTLVDENAIEEVIQEEIPEELPEVPETDGSN
jgi:preprotein translocase subunit SecG|tara:strand:+ start:4286 stop:4678 length:393 start_codon:yes stop_codon:yes gene_type:complete